MRKLVVLCLVVGLAGASNFYIFYKQVGVVPNCPALSIDAANNAPFQRKWTMDRTGAFAKDTIRGDWLIRAVLDWTPQDTNASTVWFATNMPNDTVANINFQIRVMIKNMGKDTLPIGTPVRLSITGPASYSYDDTLTTATKLKHGATTQVSFSPAWHIPSQAGVFHIKVWTEAAGEQWPADDTIAYDLNVDWIQYHTDAQMHWLTWGTPERAVKFDPADFGLLNPVGITRLRANFYFHDTIPWPDTSFTFKIYGGNGTTLLYESDTLEAIPGKPGPYRYYDLDSAVFIESGSFYVAVVPVSATGHPSSCGDSSVGGHSYWGSSSYWYPWDPDTSQLVGGDLFISARVAGAGLGSTERWIGPSESPRSTPPARPAAARNEVCTARAEPCDGWVEDAQDAVLAPEPWLLPSSSILYPGTVDTLKYDNGTPTRAWCEAVAGNGRGVKFISPAESVTLAGALVHFYSGWPSPGDTWASFRVYADDGIGGAPGTELYSLDSVNIKMGAWNYVPLAPVVAVAEGVEPGLGVPSLGIVNYPNPVSDRVTLKWQVPRCTPVAVNLYDAAGRLKQNLYTANDRATSGILIADTRLLAAGIYLVRLETAAGSATRKLVVDK